MSRKKGLEEFMIDDLKLLYNAEKQFEKALPKLMKSAYSKELQFILQNHLTETGHQINRLEEISQMLGKSFSGKKSKEMQYLIEDGKEVSDTDVEKGFKDFVLIAVLQKIVFFKLSAYWSTKNYARLLAYTTIEELLNQAFEEENNTYEMFNEISVSLDFEMAEESEIQKAEIKPE